MLMHLRKLRDTPVARLSYGCFEGEHQQRSVIVLSTVKVL